MSAPPPPPPPAVAAQLLAAYLAMKMALRAQVVGMVAGAWAGLSSWRDADVAAFAAAAAPIVTAGQAQMGALTQGYLVQAVGRSATGLRAPTTGAALRAGVDPADVYRRPGVEVWTALSKGTPLDQAVAQGARRAAVLAQTDLQLAATHAAQQTLASSPHIVGYRRVTTGANSCALCVVASTQRYHAADLMPIHPGCDCIVEPITGYTDPGRVLDQGALDAAHAEIATRLGTDTNNAAVLRQQLIVHQHGELGPILAQRDQHFTGPAEIPSAA